MATIHSCIRNHILLYHLVIISMGAQQLAVPIAVRAQADSSKSLQRAAPRTSGSTAAGTPAVGELFQQRCVKCHGADGTAKPARDRLAKIPNFTDPSWQAQRSDAQLQVSILDGKELEMPSWRGKISEEQGERPGGPRPGSSLQTPGTPKGAPPPGVPRDRRKKPPPWRAVFLPWTLRPPSG